MKFTSKFVVALSAAALDHPSPEPPTGGDHADVLNEHADDENEEEELDGFEEDIATEVADAEDEHASGAEDTTVHP